MLQEQHAPTSIAMTRSLDRLVSRLMKRADLEGLHTEDDLFSMVNTVVTQFTSSLGDLHLSKINITPGATLSPRGVLDLVEAVSEDLHFAYDGVLQSQTEVVRRYGRYRPLANDLGTRLGETAGVTSNITQQSTRHLFEISESFASQAALVLDPKSPPGIDTQAGVLTLPVESFEYLPIAKLETLDRTNGIVDPVHPESHAFDDNADTWLAISRVTDGTTGPLIVEILATLRAPGVINFLQLQPALFDDRAFSKVEAIETSLDGQSFRSIRSSYPVLLDAEEERALFTLGPVGLRNRAEAHYWFTPRIARYVRIRLRQDRARTEPLITYQDLTLQEIRIGRAKFADRGVVESTEFTLPFHPRKVQIIETASLSRPLTDIQYELSFDSGSSWTVLDPLDITTLTVDPSLTAGEDLGRIRLTAIRDQTSFRGIARPLAGRISSVTQRLASTATPVDIGLSNIPLEDSVAVYRQALRVGGTHQGSRIAEAHGEDNITIILPLAITPFSETILVNGEAWTRTSNLALASADDRVYEINYTTSTLKFGDSRTALAPVGTIRILLDDERCSLPSRSPIRIQLDHSHDFNPDHLTLRRFDRIRRVDKYTLPRNTSQINLPHDGIVQQYLAIEEVPPGVSVFYPRHIPATVSDLLFSDEVRFATRVERDPAATGEYRVEFVSTRALSPARITVYGTTHPIDAGSVTIESRAKIIDPTATYTEDDWLASIDYPTLSTLAAKIARYEPIFSDTTVFTQERTYVDGRAELTTPGDYSINYEAGRIHLFATTPEDRVVTLDYSHIATTILNWKFTEDDQTIELDETSFLVNHNDAIPAILENNGTQSYLVYRDRRWIEIPLGTPSPYLGVQFTEDDYLRGTLLPADRRRVQLDHETILNGSVRFVHLSDAINAFDDAIVTTETDGTRTISLRPIRDVYGNALTTEDADDKTQREIDRETLRIERNYIDGEQELTAHGDYSIDYRNGVLFTFSAVPSHTVIQYEYVDIRATYYATKALTENDQYTVDFENLRITIHGVGDDLASEDVGLIARYEIVADLRDDPVAVLSYYSPILMKYEMRFKP